MRTAKEAFAEVRSLIEQKTPRAGRVVMPMGTRLHAEWGNGTVIVWVTVTCIRGDQDTRTGRINVAMGHSSFTATTPERLLETADFIKKIAGLGLTVKAHVNSKFPRVEVDDA